jgi:AcrR family transcriptional regulator
MTRRRARPALLAGEDLLPRPRQTRSADKRARLKAAALALFGERGYERVSIDDIASRAGLAVGGFYLHFRSKRQLLLALMDDLLENLEALDLRPSPSPSPDVRAGLRRLLGRAASSDLHYAGAYRAWQEAVLSDADLAARQRAIQAWTTKRVATAFTLLSSLPGARRGVDVDALARVMDGVFWGLIAQLGRLSRKERDRAIDAATHLVYHALFAD